MKNEPPDRSGFLSDCILEKGQKAVGLSFGDKISENLQKRRCIICIACCRHIIREEL